MNEPTLNIPTIQDATQKAIDELIKFRKAVLNDIKEHLAQIQDGQAVLIDDLENINHDRELLETNFEQVDIDAATKIWSDRYHAKFTKHGQYVISDITMDLSDRLEAFDVEDREQNIHAHMLTDAANYLATMLQLLKPECISNAQYLAIEQQQKDEAEYRTGVLMTLDRFGVMDEIKTRLADLPHSGDTDLTDIIDHLYQVVENDDIDHINAHIHSVFGVAMKVNGDQIIKAVADHQINPLIDTTIYLTALYEELDRLEKVGEVNEWGEWS